MTTPADPDPDPDVAAAIAEVQRIVNDARQASTQEFVCALCRRPFPLEQLAATTPALCQDCRRRQQEQER